MDGRRAFRSLSRKNSSGITIVVTPMGKPSFRWPGRSGERDEIEEVDA
jgi:hypothetical protein